MQVMSSRLIPHRKAVLLTLALVLAAATIEFAMGRPPICPCGFVKFWHGVVESDQNSQQIADWYTFSHVTHGLIFYFAGWLLFVRLGLFGGKPARWALPIAAFVEAAWEVLENTPMVIDRYREVTVSYGYAGDSMVNSIADIGWMIVGFLIASRLPAWASVLLAIFFELFTLWAMRDNLTLNIIMLLWPIEAIRQWQEGA
ncbi:DUF2585 domain-containing protein [Tsuneonella mangrovi]|uniref:DUF2585 domain-containing protein n=1 Tax=Tsuneonella mangrovi TaxID=1982042 RepID=UPI003B82CA3C